MRGRAEKVAGVLQAARGKGARKPRAMCAESLIFAILAPRMRNLPTSSGEASATRFLP